MALNRQLSAEQQTEVIGSTYAYRRLFKKRSIGEIAREVGLPLRKASRELSRMRETGFATISTSVDHRKLGIQTALVFVKTRSAQRNNQFFENAIKMPFVEQVAQIAGSEATHVITVKTPDFGILKNVIAGLRGEAWGTVRQPAGAEKLVEWSKSELVYDYGVEQCWRYSTEDKDQEVLKIDSADWHILAILQDNALTPLEEIGRKVGLRAPTILRRIRKLEEAKVIHGYFCEIFWQNIPLHLQPGSAYFFAKYGGPMPAVYEFTEKLANFKSLYFGDIYYLYGDEDLSGVVLFRSISDFQRFNHDIGEETAVREVKSCMRTRFHWRSTVFEDFAKWQAKKDAEL